MGSDWLCSPRSRPFGEVRFVAVAICLTRRGNTHCGVLHNGDTGPTTLLHLAWHHDLRSEAPGAEYLWVQPSVHRARARSIAALCRLIWRRYSADRRMPYALRYDGDAFDATTGELLLKGSTHGLTCATLLLAIFQTFGIRLLDCATWPPRAEDNEQQASYLQLLRGTGAADDHCRAVQSEIGCVRFRPEEVVGAASGAVFPSSFDYAREAAREILSALGGIGSGSQG